MTDVKLAIITLSAFAMMIFVFLSYLLLIRYERKHYLPDNNGVVKTEILRKDNNANE